MPKITIKTLPLDASIEIVKVLKRLGNDLADTLDISPGQLIIIWEPIAADHFLFNGQVTRVQEKSSHHPIVEVTAIEGMPGNLEKLMVHTIARTLSRELSVDYTNICVILNMLAPGKLFVSGKFKELSVKSQ